MFEYDFYMIYLKGENLFCMVHNKPIIYKTYFLPHLTEICGCFQITTNSANPTVYMDSLMHSNEWIAGSTLLLIADIGSVRSINFITRLIERNTMQRVKKQVHQKSLRYHKVYNFIHTSCFPPSSWSMVTMLRLSEWEAPITGTSPLSSTLMDTSIHGVL